MMEGDVSGVRISPPVVEFYDTEPNNVHQLNVTVKNISKTSKSIRFYGPKTKVILNLTFMNNNICKREPSLFIHFIYLVF